MRNAITPLDSTDLHAAHVALNALAGGGLFGQVVSFTARKRDDRNDVSERSGTIVEFSGDSMLSNGSVRVNTLAGERTFNLYLISDVQVGDLFN